MKRYFPDFPLMMRVCETNYAQLRRLLPHRGEVGASQDYQVNDTTYRITIIESTRYTSLVDIQQVAQESACWGLPSMKVRLYHDALVAEVCASQQISRFKSRYDYPNKHLHQRDEKYQVNQFLADWLRYCLTYGVMAIAVY